jgi:hypothetical protein
VEKFVLLIYSPNLNLSGFFLFLSFEFEFCFGDVGILKNINHLMLIHTFLFASSKC